MNRPGMNLLTGDEALNELRERQGLYERVPSIIESHPVAIGVGEVPNMAALILCAHDTANERAHTLAGEFPAGAEFVTEEFITTTAQLVLAAAYN